MRFRLYRTIVVVGLSFLTGWHLVAQVAPDARRLPNTLSIGGTYESAKANNDLGHAFRMNGGSAEMNLQFSPKFGLIGDGTMLHSPQMTPQGPGLRLVTMTCGPRYTWSANAHGISFFAQGLVGGALGFNRLSSKYPVGYGLATLTGGGINLSISPHLVFRPVDAGWLRTNVPNATTDVQNFLRLGAGLIVRIR